MEKNKTVKYNLKGFVQGVGFRSFCHYHAVKFDLSGSVRNLSNGDVELIVQGSPKVVSLFFEKIRFGPSGCLVEDVSIEELTTPLERKGFTIL